VKTPYREIWCADFEFRSDPGERPYVICLAAREFYSGVEVRMWRDELLALRQAPFNVGSDAAFVCYYAPAELGCFLELGWRFPANIIDLFVEHRVATNQERRRARRDQPTKPIIGNKLIDALALRGLPHINASEKDEMRQLCMTRWEWTQEERAAILDYCATDYAALTALLPVMALTIDWARAAFRGRYMGAVARMQREGVPIDLELFLRLHACWDQLKLSLIPEIDRDYGVYENGVFKKHLFAKYLAAHNIDWFKRTPTGALAMDAETWKDMAAAHPILQPLRELVVTLTQMRYFALGIGKDAKNRCMLSPFRTVTSRNQPSGDRARPKETGFVFMPARWVRGLIKPAPGEAIAYCDWTAQEIAIAAGLSGDKQLMGDYKTDIYLRFAVAAGIAPDWATKDSHEVVREVCKTICLGVGYGMQSATMATRAGITRIEARELLRAHRAVYSTFWSWIRGVVDTALFTGQMRTMFGWRVEVDRLNPNPNMIMNWMAQSHGAEMMRIAAIAATEAGIRVCAPVHDAFLITSSSDKIDQDTTRMKEIMAKAGRAVTGIDVRVDAKIWHWPGRYVDKRGKPMFDLIFGLLERFEGTGPGSHSDNPGLQEFRYAMGERELT